MQSNSIEERIKLVRNTLKLTQETFGRKLGVSKSFIVNIELQRKLPLSPDDPFVELLCSVYHVNSTWLTIGEGEMFTSADNSSLAALQHEYSLSPAAMLVIQRFIEMNDTERDAFLKTAKAIIGE